MEPLAEQQAADASDSRPPANSRRRAWKRINAKETHRIFELHGQPPQISKWLHGRWKLFVLDPLVGQTSHHQISALYNSTALKLTMAESTSISTSQPTSQELPQFSFSLFVKLPAELQLDILSHCRTNDLVCLSLSSHYFRDLTQPFIPRRPKLLSYDQTLSVEQIQCACGDKLPSHMRIAQHALSHRKRRHMYVYEVRCRGVGDVLASWDLRYPPFRQPLQNHSACHAYPADHLLCRKRGCAHCSCTTCPLHVRLRSWMGDRKYCHQCRKFTVRMQTKKYKGRCECLSCEKFSLWCGTFH